MDPPLLTQTKTLNLITVELLTLYLNYSSGGGGVEK